MTVLASVAMCIALLVLTPNKHSSAAVFGSVTDGSGWNSKGFSFMIGFLSVAWTMTDYDATTHMSEETKQAAIRGPVAITQAVLISGVIGLLLNITLSFCAGDIAATLASGTGNPAAQIVFNAAGSKGGMAIWFWVVLIQFCTGCSAMVADTRMCYAFSRDGALPFSE
jgi:amino acid transporter